MLLTAVAILLIAGLFLAERRWAASPGSSDRLNNVYAFLLTFGAQICLLPLVSLNPLVERFAIFHLSEWHIVPPVLAYLVLMDFAEFAFHRAQHAVPWLWRMHSLHHSDPNMNVTTTVRHFWGDKVIKSLTIWPACALLFHPSPAVLVAYAAISLYHYFVHANVPVNFGRWSLLLNHPAYHRRHHSSEPEHFGSNYASLFPIFDWMCGTYRRPDGFPPTGLDHRPQGFTDVALWPLRSRA